MEPHKGFLGHHAEGTLLSPKRTKCHGLLVCTGVQTPAGKLIIMCLETQENSFEHASSKFDFYTNLQQHCITHKKK